MSEDKSPEARKFVAQFLEWILQIGGDNMLYRGFADKSWEAEASLHRRIRGKNKSAPKEKFVQASEHLVGQAKQRGYTRDPAGELTGLQLMSRLQHYGAATCLIDFTRNPQVALWFACQPPNQKGDSADGKVIAVDSGNPAKYQTVQLKHLDYSWGDFMRAGHLWKWRPEDLDNRIFAQHSEFIFGEPIVLADKDIVIPAALKADILGELAKNDISEERLFPDFYGFMQINAHDRPYYRKSAHSYAVLAVQEARLGNYQEALHWYGVAITKDPDNPDWFNNHGNANSELGNYEDAIADFNETLKIRPNYATTYSNRGIAKERWCDRDGTVAAYNYADAIADFDRALKINQKDEFALHNRERVKKKLEDSSNS